MALKFASLLILLFCLGFLPGNEGNQALESNVKNENPAERVVRVYSGGTITYTFLATADIFYRRTRTLGKIETPIKGCKATSFKSYSNYIIVDRYTGFVRLSRRCPQIPKLITTVQVTTTCDYSNSQNIVRVIVWVFPRNFGDQFLRSYIKKINNMVKENKKFDHKKGMATSLHRIMRMVLKEKNPESFNELMASGKVDIAIYTAINDILEKHVEKSSEQRIVFVWSLNFIFSSQILSQLSDAAQCNRKQIPVCPRNDEYRTIDGTCNNLNDPLFGSAPIALVRFAPARYFDPDGFTDPIGFPGQNNVPDIPATLKVAETFIVEQAKPQKSVTKLSHLVMQYGQFLDHDLDLSPESENSDKCAETSGDGSKEDFFPPCYTILPFKYFQSIHFARSATECLINGTNQLDVRQQINVNTAFVDGSQIYGSTKELAERLRDSSNKALLKTRRGINGDFLPQDNSWLMAPNSFCKPDCFLAGDSRTNEQMLLTCMHTLFVREHNRIARKLADLDNDWDGEKTFQEARKIVGAVLQKITYEDFLPIIIGRDALKKYKKYDPSVDPGILNSFATAAFRFGHSLIRPTFDRLDKGFNPTGNPLPLRELFFNNTFIDNFGIGQLLRGLLANESQTVDRQLADGILNNLFERPDLDAPGLNLAALNIQRGRDHGLPGYNSFRIRCGLKNAKSFSDTAGEINYKNRLLLSKLYYDDPNLADLWVAGLAETPFRKGGIVGPTFRCIIGEQMRRVRDGDRFFYENKGVFTEEQLAEIKKTSFSRIFCDNLKNIVSVQKDSFQAGSIYNRVSCNRIPGIDLNKWKSDGGSTGPYSCPGCLRGKRSGKFCTRQCNCEKCSPDGKCSGFYICGEQECSYESTKYNRCGLYLPNVVSKKWKLATI